MRRAHPATCLVPLLASLALATPRASTTGAPAAHTGGFGEMTCQQCHWENPLNEPAGRVRLDGLPEAYTPGEQYLITVTLARPGMEAAGFQLSAREDGMSMNAGNNAGALRALDALADTVEGEAKRIRYVQHTRAGAGQVTAGSASWTFAWTAPDDGPVIFHLAANAANGDDSPLGDFIYTAVARSRPLPRVGE